MANTRVPLRRGVKRSTSITKQPVSVMPSTGAMAQKSSCGSVKVMFSPSATGGEHRGAALRGLLQLLTDLGDRGGGAVQEWLGIDPDPQDQRDKRDQHKDLA